MGDLDGYFGELGQEMRAIAECLDVDLGIVVTLNFAYELRRVRLLTVVLIDLYNVAQLIPRLGHSHLTFSCTEPHLPICYLLKYTVVLYSSLLKFDDPFHVL